MRIEIESVVNKGYTMKLAGHEIGITDGVCYYATWEDLLASLQQIYKACFEEIDKA